MTSSNTYKAHPLPAHCYESAPLARNTDLTSFIRHDAVTQERNRLAHELHDGITQQITHALHKLEYIQRLLETNNSQSILGELQHIQRTLNTSLHDLRNTMSGLLSTQVERRALVAVIRQIIHEYQSHHPEIELILKVTGLDNTQFLPLHFEAPIQHFFQEALTNVWKHAHATCINVQLQLCANWLIVEVSDNGIGFQAAEVLADPEHQNEHEQHFGLYMLYHCITEANGCWELQSRLGEGTTLRVCFPLARPISELT